MSQVEEAAAAPRQSALHGTVAARPSTSAARALALEVDAEARALAPKTMRSYRGVFGLTGLRNCSGTVSALSVR